MPDEVVAKYMGKFMDEGGSVVDQDGGISIEFYTEAVPDQLLTEGGEIEKRHPKVKQIQKREAEALALLRAESPFAEEEPPQAGAEPTGLPADAPDAQKKKFAKDYAAWEAAKRERTAWVERRDAHEAELKEQSRLLLEHPAHPTLYTVKAMGRPVYEDLDFIRKRIPGDKDQIVERRVREEDRRKYPERWRLYKAGQSQAAIGTPLEKWAGLEKSQVLEMAHFGIKTVEHLAGVSDEGLSKIGPYIALRQKARDWLATARGNAPVDALRADLARKDNDIQVLKRMLEEQAASLKELKEQKQAR